MDELIVILGVSGVGKTHALKEVFNVDKAYGYATALKGMIPVKGKYQYIPELKGNAIKNSKDVLLEIFKKPVITEVNYVVPSALHWLVSLNCKIIILSSTIEEITRNMKTRKGADKSTLINKSINSQTRLLTGGFKTYNIEKYETLTQKQLILYLNEITRN